MEKSHSFCALTNFKVISLFGWQVCMHSHSPSCHNKARENAVNYSFSHLELLIFKLIYNLIFGHFYFCEVFKTRPTAYVSHHFFGNVSIEKGEGKEVFSLLAPKICYCYCIFSNISIGQTIWLSTHGVMFVFSKSIILFWNSSTKKQCVDCFLSNRFNQLILWLRNWIPAIKQT